MKIEIDQSGKLENTNISTVVGFSNGKSKSIIISSREKIKLQNYFRSIGKRKIHVYYTFAAMIYLLIKDERNIEQIAIDTEYPGQTPLIKNYLLLFLSKTKKKIDKNNICFKQISRKSNAHIISINSYRKKRADMRIVGQDIINLTIKRSGIN